VIDDQIALIGSANINDRSMLGIRDSELAVVVEDIKGVPSKMNGAVYEARRFALTLRASCFRDIFGFQSLEEVMDPLDKRMWETINHRTKVISYYNYSAMLRSTDRYLQFILMIKSRAYKM